MPVDGLGSDAGRQSLTDVGAADVRARRKAGATRTPPARRDADPIAPTSANEPARDAPPTPRAHARGERLVAISALAVLAIAALFFVERIGSLVGAPAPAPFTPPALDLKTLPVDPVAAPPSTPSTTAPTSRATPPARVANARPRATAIAKVRKPPSRPVAQARQAPIVLASAEPWLLDATVPTRWERMQDEVIACADEPFFLDAVVCDQRVRHRYCDDWWGRADACPSGRTADYGN
jgi:hypothetical protein